MSSTRTAPWHATPASPRTPSPPLANGGIPDELSEHEKIAARLAHQLSTSHRVDDELYSEAEQAFGTTGLFDIAALIGQYHTVCTALTLFEVPAPN
jgi:4-carboxymuconolactone decarboxylase